MDVVYVLTVSTITEPAFISLSVRAGMKDNLQGFGALPGSRKALGNRAGHLPKNRPIKVNGGQKR
jgi:hypothetical protein